MCSRRNGVGVPSSGSDGRRFGYGTERVTFGRGGRLSVGSRGGEWWVIDVQIFVRLYLVNFWVYRFCLCK